MCVYSMCIYIHISVLSINLSRSTYIYIYIYTYIYLHRYTFTRAISPTSPFASSRAPCHGSAFTRYCHYQYCMAGIATQDGRGEKLYCAVVWAMKGGGGGVPNNRGVCKKSYWFLYNGLEQNKYLVKAKSRLGLYTIFFHFNAFVKDRQVTHTHTPTGNNTNNTPDTDTHAHDKNNTPNPQTNTSHKHLTTLEGGATTVRATSTLLWTSHHRYIAPPTCKAHTVAIVLHDYCARYAPSPKG